MSQTKAQLLEPTGVFTLTNQLVGVGATFSGNVSIAGTLTKQDVTNVDSVGVITARAGIDCTGITSITGADDIDNFVIDVGGGTQFAVHTDTTDGEVSLRSQDGSGNNYSKYMTFFTQPSGAVAAPRLTITSGGGLKYHNADSPTNAPSQSQILNHTGGLTFYGSSDSGTHRNIIFGTNNAAAGERLRITSTGLVGIGTNNPSQLLHLEKDSFHSILLKRTGASPSEAIFANEGNFTVIKNNASGIQFSTGATPSSKVVIKGDGKTGIGTINPTRGPLHVHENSTGDVQIHLTNQETGTTSSDGFTIFSGANAGPNAGFVNREDGGTIAFYTHNGSSVGVRLTLSHTGNLTSTGTVSDSKGDLRKIPINFHNAGTYTLVAADAGKVVSEATMGSNITVPASTFVGGDAITIMNHTGNNITLTQGSGVTMYNAADASTGNRTLAGRGFATIFYREHNVVYISGSGLS